MLLNRTDTINTRIERSNERVDALNRRLDAERERLIGALRQFSYVRHIWPSAANFFLVQVDDTQQLLQQSTANKILLRYFGEPLADCVRISVGTPSDNDRLLQMFAAMEAR